MYEIKNQTPAIIMIILCINLAIYTRFKRVSFRVNVRVRVRIRVRIRVRVRNRVKTNELHFFNIS